MSRTFIILMLFAFDFSWATLSNSYTLPLASLTPAEFIAHEEDAPMKSYLALNLPYENFKQLSDHLGANESLTLKNRGEAHVTIISPLEFDNVLKSKMSIAEINNIALSAGLQKVRLKAVCLGQGEKVLNEKPEKTFFVVVRSKDLLKIRQKIEKEFIKRGGDSVAFKANNFYPHVTLGFTSRDLHFEDGVVKDVSSCHAKLRTVPGALQ